MADDLTKTPSQWFIGEAEYGCRNGTFKMLNCGEAVFGELYRAIQEARHSINYICWAFQPSMYFVRDGRTLSIGELLEEKALQGVKVRVLCWAFPEVGDVNVTGTQGEPNMPGSRPGGIADRPKTHTKEQYEYDKWWYWWYLTSLSEQQSNLSSVADTNPIFEDYLQAGRRISRPRHVAARTEGELEKMRRSLEFRTRGFSLGERHDIRHRNYTDKDLSTMHRVAMAATPSHHQKVVVIDVESSDDHVAFVMGHNTLDPYWDTPGHSYHHHSGQPGKGRNIATPRQDISSRVTGPIVGDLYSNFRVAWEKEGSGKLPEFSDAYFRNFPFYTSKLVACEGAHATRESIEAALGSITTGGAQIVRTQIQNKPPRFDIRDSYRNAIKNAACCIFIENQYFRWPPMAGWIKEAAQASRGHKPDRPLYLFVITNSSDEGMGSGTHKTWQMLDSLGRADVMPGVARKKRIDDLDDRIGQIDREIGNIKGQNSPLAEMQFEHYLSAKDREKIARLEEEKKRLLAQRAELQKDTEGKTIQSEERPGLKVHICTLTAPDTPAGVPWPEVYVHSKLMTVDDVYMMLGSANINTRSMETDSELNIAHANADITRKIRRELWAQHTNGKGAQNSMKRAFEEWGRIIDENRDNERDLLPPVASLRGFLRTNPDITDLD